ncbi:hypothetical protein TWF718_001679 [Orbilia javanica]|uniref:Uncharacterized protein n=1 Tax=Orbilia javanica TaxID=47235 RepID=A0AAN8N163_9PEZI
MGNKTVNLALYGCADKNLAPGDSFATILGPGAYLTGLNIFVDKARSCELHFGIFREQWVDSDEYRKAKAKADIWAKCPNYAGLDGSLTWACTQLQYEVPPPTSPDPDKPPGAPNCDGIPFLVRDKIPLLY